MNSWFLEILANFLLNMLLETYYHCHFGSNILSNYIFELLLLCENVLDFQCCEASLSVPLKGMRGVFGFVCFFNQCYFLWDISILFIVHHLLTVMSPSQSSLPELL